MKPSSPRSGSPGPRTAGVAISVTHRSPAVGTRPQMLARQARPTLPHSARRVGISFGSVGDTQEHAALYSEYSQGGAKPCEGISLPAPSLAPKSSVVGQFCASRKLLTFSMACRRPAQPAQSLPARAVYLGCRPDRSSASDLGGKRGLAWRLGLELTRDKASADTRAEGLAGYAGIDAPCRLPTWIFLRRGPEPTDPAESSTCSFSS